MLSDVNTGASGGETILCTKKAEFKLEELQNKNVKFDYYKTLSLNFSQRKPTVSAILVKEHNSLYLAAFTKQDRHTPTCHWISRDQSSDFPEPSPLEAALWHLLRAPNYEQQELWKKTDVPFGFMSGKAHLSSMWTEEANQL